MARPKKFVPYRDQINCAKLRIQGYLERNHGEVQLESEDDIRALHKHISQPRDLGCRLDDQLTTLRIALDELKKDHQVVWNSKTNMLSATYAFKPHRQQKQRFASRPSFRTA